MKKTYIIPEMEIIKIATRQMLADSSMSSRGDYGSGVTIGSRGYYYDDEE